MTYCFISYFLNLKSRMFRRNVSLNKQHISFEIVMSCLKFLEKPQDIFVIQFIIKRDVSKRTKTFVLRLLCRV